MAEDRYGRISNTDPVLWRELRLEAVRRGVPMHVVWDEIMREWLERKAAAESPSPAREAMNTAAIH